MRGCEFAPVIDKSNSPQDTSEGYLASERRAVEAGISNCGNDFELVEEPKVDITQPM